MINVSFGFKQLCGEENQYADIEKGDTERPKRMGWSKRLDQISNDAEDDGDDYPIDCVF